MMKFSKLYFVIWQISDKIICCEECGDGELIKSILHTYYKEFDFDKEVLKDPARTVMDLMSDVFKNRENLWEPHYKHLIEFVCCPECKNGSGENYEDKIDYGTFGWYTDVYTKPDIDQFNHDFYGDELKEIENEISYLARSFSYSELVDLKNDYLKNREYAVRNPLFHKLECSIESLFEQSKWYVLAENRIVFRTRTSSSSKTFSKEELWEPPFGYAKQGRYNNTGVSMFYCANNKEVIKKEVTLPDKHNYNIGKFILHKPMHLFPINYTFGDEFTGLIDEAVPIGEKDFEFKRQYILSNIVSAICAKTGYNGIVYRSTKDNSSIDYAIFSDYEKGKDLEILDIEIERH